MHLGNETLDLALLLSTDRSGALEKVCSTRHATDELPVILRIRQAIFNNVLDQIRKRTPRGIGGVRDSGINTIDEHRR